MADEEGMTDYNAFNSSYMVSYALISSEQTAHRLKKVF